MITFTAITVRTLVTLAPGSALSRSVSAARRDVGKPASHPTAGAGLLTTGVGGRRGVVFADWIRA